MDVAFACARGGDADHLGPALQLLDRRAAAIAHPGAQAAHQLVDDRCRVALVGDTPFDALGHELVGGASAFEIEVVPEAAVAAASPHRADSAHPPVVLVASALE